MNRQFTSRATAMVVTTTIMIGMGLTPILQQQSANALSDPDGSPVSGHKTPLPHHIPIAKSGTIST